MKLRVAIARYRRRFLRPLATAAGAVVEREGVILSLTDTDGRVGQGEAAPISWIDGELLDDVITELVRLGDALELTSRVLDEEDACRSTWLGDVGRGFGPSARAALDTASLDLAARRAGISAARRLGAGDEVSVSLNALVVGSRPEDVADAVRARMKRGYRVVKLKVGAGEPGFDIERVSAARGELRGSATLRLDANAAWSFDVAREVLEEIGPARVDYVEEPLATATVTLLARLGAVTGVPIAVDESFDRLGGAELLAASRCCDVVVLKPARVGGPTRAVELAQGLVASGLRVVLTDAIETAIGRAAVVHAAVALATTGASEAIGLGGIELLAPDAGAVESDDFAGTTELLAEGPGLAVTVAHEQSIR